MNKIKNILALRILILDGAMGTMIQRYKLTEDDFGGERFKDSTVLLKGNNDLLCLTQPSVQRSSTFLEVKIKAQP